MIVEVFDNRIMGNSFSSDWIPLVYPRVEDLKRTMKAKVLILYWSEAQAGCGSIVLEGGSSLQSAAKGLSYDIDCDDNRSDVLTIELHGRAEYLRINYISKQACNGKISAIIYFGD